MTNSLAYLSGESMTQHKGKLLSPGLITLDYDKNNPVTNTPAYLSGESVTQNKGKLVFIT